MVGDLSSCRDNSGSQKKRYISLPDRAGPWIQAGGGIRNWKVEMSRARDSLALITQGCAPLLYQAAVVAKEVHLEGLVRQWSR